MHLFIVLLHTKTLNTIKHKRHLKICLVSDTVILKYSFRSERIRYFLNYIIVIDLLFLKPEPVSPDEVKSNRFPNRRTGDS